MKFINICNKIIEYSFYALFFLVPLAFTDKTSELFEFNKMWLTFGITIVIATTWLCKMILQRRILLCRTPLDIPIILFLLSQFVSTVFSLDTHVSIWGYYSRFNGGFLSILSYILLYYAFLSNLGNLGNLLVKRILLVSLISGAIVALWGFPSHFGHDPTCLIFRGTFDVSCWTEAFQPKIRIFSTLGQPNWMAAYLAILIPISIALALNILPSQFYPQQKNQKSKIKNQKYLILTSLYLILTILFYTDLLFTASNSGFLGLIGVGTLFFLLLLWLLKKSREKILKNPQFLFLLFTLIIIGAISFSYGTPFTPNLSKIISKTRVSKTVEKQSSVEPKKEVSQGPLLETGGTASSKIRTIVWKGAIDIWRNNPIFGTGVETYAFAYYKYRPASHNLTSEWDYLYNKAHNEYLNYLATTGAFGLGSYSLMIGSFFFIVFKKLKTQNSKPGNEKLLTLNFALLAAYTSILISNFFGFSVVIVNLYLFMIPAFVFILSGIINPEKVFVFPNLKTLDSKRPTNEIASAFQWLAIIVVIFIASLLQFTLFRFWLADINYSMGSNLNKLGQYREAYLKLKEAVSLRDNEPTFLDEMSLNEAILSTAILNRKDELSKMQNGKEYLESAEKGKNEAISISDRVISEHPNNIVSVKTRVRVLYTLSQTDPQYLPLALQAIIKANTLAPTDAKISYNLGVIYGQNGNTEKAIETLNNTIKLKPDYRDAFFALSLFYHQAAVDKTERIVNPELQQKAVESMKYILDNFSTQDAQAKQALEKWTK